MTSKYVLCMAILHLPVALASCSQRGENEHTSSGPLTFTFYQSKLFTSKCAPVPGALGGIGPAEGLPITGLTCHDSWYELFCDDRSIYVLENLNTKNTAKVYIQSVCPHNHWKNLLKTRIGIPSCNDTQHVDLEQETLSGFGLDYDDQGTVFVSLSK